MGKSLNRVFLIGFVGQDPELRYTYSGKAVSSISLATNEEWKNADGRKVKKTIWHKVTLWGKMAERLSPHIKKSMQIRVEGSIDYSEWIDKDGKKHLDAVIKPLLYNGIMFLGKAEHQHQEDNNSPAAGFESDEAPPLSDDDIPF